VKAVAKPAAKPAVKAAAKPAVKAVATPTAKSNLRAVATTGSAAPKSVATLAAKPNLKSAVRASASPVAASATKSAAKSEQSLDGVWETGGGKFKVTFSGNTGVVSAISDTVFTEAYQNDSVTKGFVRVGSEFYSKIKSSGNLKWSGKVLFPRHRDSVATGTGYRACTLTMSADGQTLKVDELAWKRSGEKPANVSDLMKSIPFKQVNLKDKIEIISVTREYLGSHVQIEYKAKETIPVMTIYVKCFYKGGDYNEWDNVEHNVEKGETYTPIVTNFEFKDITRVEISFEESGKPESIQFEQLNRKDTIEIKSVKTWLGQIQIEYKALKRIKEMTIFIKCFYKHGTSFEYEIKARNAKKDHTYKPFVTGLLPVTTGFMPVANLASANISIIDVGFGKLKDWKKVDLDNLEDVEDYLNILIELLGEVDNDEVQVLKGHLEKISEKLGIVNKTWNVCETISDMAKVVDWGDKYKNAKTDVEKMGVAREGRKKMLEIISNLSGFAGGDLYGKIIPVVCDMVHSVCNIIENHGLQIEKVSEITANVTDPNHQAFHNVYEHRFDNLVFDIFKEKMKTMKEADAITATFKDSTAVITEILELENK